MTGSTIRPHEYGTSSLFSDAEAIELLRRMIETSSVSGDERAVAVLLSQEMSRRGFVSEIDAVGNAIGWRGPRDAEQVIVLLGHMDTVPGMIPVRIEGDRLFGRGSVDAKGPLATFVVAASRAALPSNTAIVAIGAVEEEAPTSRGARAVVDRFRPAACVIGEPSAGNGITIGYKGRLVMEHSIVHDLSHTAGPSGSAADEAFAFWQRVLTKINSLNQGRTGAFDTIQATLRDLRTSGDGLTEQASLIAGFRLPPGLDPNVLQQAIAPLASTGQLDFLGHEIAHVSPRDNAVARHLSAAIRRAGERPVLRVKTGTSDMNVVAPRWRCPIVAYGPGDSALDHTPNENISLSEYLHAARVLTHALESLASELGAEARRPADTVAQSSSLTK